MLSIKHLKGERFYFRLVQKICELYIYFYFVGIFGIVLAMVEKFRGILPPGSIWYKLNRDESLVLMKHRGVLANMSPEQIQLEDSAEIQAPKGKVLEFEQMLKDAGLEIITLYD